MHIATGSPPPALGLTTFPECNELAFSSFRRLGPTTGSSRVSIVGLAPLFTAALPEMDPSLAHGQNNPSSHYVPGHS